MLDDPILERLPSGRHGLPRDVVERSQRGRMLRAVLAAVAEKGYAATTVADVIGRANVSRPTFYQFWPGKAACFAEAYEAVLALLVGHLEARFARPGRWEDRVREGLRELLHWLSEYPDLARVAVVEVIASGRDGPGRYLEVIERFSPFFEEGRRTAPHGDELPATTATVVVGGLAGIVFDEVAAGRTRELPRILPELVYAALAPFTGHEQALAQMELARREAGATPEG